MERENPKPTERRQTERRRENHPVFLDTRLPGNRRDDERPAEPEPKEPKSREPQSP